MLDEATAAAEAMTLAARAANRIADPSSSPTTCHPQTLEVIRTRAPGRSAWGDHATWPSRPAAAETFAVLLQWPGVNGTVRDLAPVIEAVHHAPVRLFIVAADLLALTLIIAARADSAPTS